MQIKVPAYMKDVTNQNLLVLAWLMTTLAKTYPELKKKDKQITTIDFGFHPRDINTILQFKGNASTIIDSEPSIGRNFTIGEFSGSETRVRMRIRHEKVILEITDQKAKEIMIYLAGCLNRNLLEEGMPPIKYYNLDTYIKEHFYYKKTAKVLKRNEA